MPFPVLGIWDTKINQIPCFHGTYVLAEEERQEIKCRFIVGTVVSYCHIIKIHNKFLQYPWLITINTCFSCSWVCGWVPISVSDSK